VITTPDLPTDPIAAVAVAPIEDPSVGGFRCDVTRIGSSAVVSVQGDVDMATAPLLRKQLYAALAMPVELVVVDLVLVKFMDSSGITAFVKARQHANQLGIPFAIESAPANVHRIFKISGLLDQFGLGTGEE
jgi:anti-sigma B factor antagonist